MNAAHEQTGIALPEIPEVNLASAPPALEAGLLRAFAHAAIHCFLRPPRLVQEQAPGERPLEEHEWRIPQGTRWFL